MTIRLDGDRLSITMNPKHFSLYLTLVVALLALMIAAGCTNEVPKVTEGTLTVRIADANSRGIAPSISMYVTDYSVTVSNGQDVVGQEEVKSGVSSVEFNLKAGDYTVTVDAKNDENTTIGSGSSPITVVAGEENCVTVNVIECAGNGLFAVSIQANSGYALELSVYDGDHKSEYSGDLVYSEGVFTTAGDVSLSNGFHEFEIVRKDTDEVVEKDTLRIVKGMTSLYSASFTFYSDANVSVVNTIVVLPTIGITLNKSSFTVSDTLKASADISGLENCSSTWFVDDVAQGLFGIYGDLSLDLSDLDVGEHEITLLVRKGNIIWSESKSFTIDNPDGEFCQKPGSRITHVWKETKVVPPTHTETGLIVYTCQECGETKTVVTEKVEEHIWADNWSVEIRDGHKLLYKKCLVPGCEEKQYFGYQFADLFNVSEGVIRAKNEENVRGDIMIPTVVGDSIVTTIAGVPDYNLPLYYVTRMEIPLSVETIDDNAFEEWFNLSEVVIPDSVTSIGQSAFRNCYNLKNIVIPSSVTDIGAEAFYFTSIESVVIPSGITRIKDYTFDSCGSLKRVVFPEGLKEIGANAFVYCSSLERIDIPSTVTGIECGAFSYTSIRNIVIPSGVTYIDDSVFSGCSNLTSVELPAETVSIGSYAFEECKNLTVIRIPSTVTTIGEGAFKKCSGLKSISIPSGIETIADSLFLDCGSLSNVVLPSGLKAIDKSAFNGCDNLKNIEIPASVTTIDEGAFLGSGLTGISFCTPSSLETIGKLAFFRCTGLTGITIPDGVTEIGKYAFSKCSNLESITIPNTVTTINEAAFYQCDRLTTIIFTGTTEEWNSVKKNLADIPAGCTVKCSDGDI